MNRTYLLLSALFIMGLASCGGNESAEKEETTEETNDTSASNDVKEEPAPQLDSAAMMKAWQDYMTPGDMHKLLARLDGTFEGEVSMWMDPAAPPTVSKSTTVNKMILGGRYQESVHSGNFNGMPFEGKSIMGYDNGKKKFVSTWVDNMGSGIMIMEGTWDEGSKTIKTSGTMTDPMTGKDCDVREVFTLIDDNSHKMEMYSTGPDGKEYKNMEITYKRKK